jgi:hypothetical protein
MKCNYGRNIATAAALRVESVLCHGRSLDDPTEQIAGGAGRDHDKGDCESFEKQPPWYDWFSLSHRLYLWFELEPGERSTACSARYFMAP